LLAELSASFSPALIGDKKLFLSYLKKGFEPEWVQGSPAPNLGNNLEK
jgi:hypothetical protein